MAKVKTVLKPGLTSLIKRINDDIANPKLLNEIGETVVKNSVAQARLGKDPETLNRYEPIGGGNPEAYYSHRDRVAKKFGAGSNYGTKKSNLTITGQLLNSIKHVIKKGKVLIEAQGQHRAYSKGGKSIGNAELARIHSKGNRNLPARNVVGVSAKTREIINNKIAAYLRRNALKLRR